MIYALTEALNKGNFNILWFWPSVLSSGSIPAPFHVHWPNIALPSRANLDVPQPLSFAAWAKAIEVGMISIFSISSSIFFLETLYSLYFLLIQLVFFSDWFCFNIFTNFLFLTRSKSYSRSLNRFNTVWVFRV